MTESADEVLASLIGHQVPHGDVSMYDALSPLALAVRCAVRCEESYHGAIGSAIKAIRILLEAGAMPCCVDPASPDEPESINGVLQPRHGRSPLGLALMASNKVIFEVTRFVLSDW